MPVILGLLLRHVTLWPQHSADQIMHISEMCTDMSRQVRATLLCGSFNSLPGFRCCQILLTASPASACCWLHLQHRHAVLTCNFYRLQMFAATDPREQQGSCSNAALMCNGV